MKCKNKGMSIIYLLICISIVLAVTFLYVFIRAVRSGQFDDDYTPSVRILFEDELKNSKPKTNINSENQI